VTAPAPDDRDIRLANALAEFIDLEARGETISVDDFCRRYADLQADLRAQLNTLAEIVDEPRPLVLETPETLSGHKILDEIGSGGMGRVFLAFDQRLGRRVAIKMLANRYWDSAALRTRFMKEARAMARLSHPNIVHIHNLGQPDEPPHFVMEHIEGVPITQAAKALTLHQQVEMMHKVVVATDFLHQNQIIHRDLKPANILVGSDLQPKLLDFGLALHVEERDRLTTPGDRMGTPQYFSPEQARADAPLDARSDVFSLGVLLYELLTGVLPFRAGTLAEQVQTICEFDPVLPRRLNSNVPGELQDVCMKALEKNPVDRYGSAREMADDLKRFLTGEETLAAPTSYTRMMAGKVDQHLRELEGWKQDQILSESEYDGLRRRYDRLIEREDAWIMQVRRLTSSQVSLYLGGWLLVIAAALLVLFEYNGLTGARKVIVACATAVYSGVMGVRRWKRGGSRRIAIAELLTLCLLLPIALLVLQGEYGLSSGWTHGQEDLEFFRLFKFEKPTNAQLWWALMLSLPAYVGLRRFSRSSVFALVFAVATAVLSLVTLLRMGMLKWEGHEIYVRLIPIALLFFVAGILVEKLRYASDSRYFYPFAVTFTLMALTGIAADYPAYADWLKKVAPWTRDQQIEYLFMINAGGYFLLQAICERVSIQMHSVARVFRFVIPGHVLWPLLMLGIHAPENSVEAKTFQLLLPSAAFVFVFTSVPKQMKNFFVWGMVFLAIGIVRLQQCLFKDSRTWLVVDLLVGGVVLMLCAANYTAIKAALISAGWRREKK
jgi:serine/threonine protein kinase